MVRAWAVGAVIGAAIGGGGGPVRACTVEGDHIQFGSPAWDFDQDVIVRPAGGRPFRLTYVSARHLRAEVPARPGDRTNLEVHGLIAFAGTTEPLSYVVAQQVEAADGMVRLYPWARMTRARSDGADVVGSIMVHGPEETVEQVRVPCGAVALKLRVPAADRELIAGDGTWWKPRGHVRRFVLRARPQDDAPTISLAIQGSSGQPDRLSFKRLSVRGEWTQIAREGFRVVAIGWARTAALQRLTEAPSGGGGGGGPVPGLGDHRYGPSHDPRVYLGPAHVVVGTTIFAGRGEQPWATVEKDGVSLIVDRGDGWVRILRIPGIEGQDVPAFVTAAAVKRGP